MPLNVLLTCEMTIMMVVTVSKGVEEVVRSGFLSSVQLKHDVTSNGIFLPYVFWLSVQLRKQEKNVFVF